MAEDEIRKHAHAVINIMKDAEKGWKHKLKDITIEVLIIVFAVTISIWLHNLSEKISDRKAEQQFLIGFRADLKGDIVNIKSSLGFYQNSANGLRYFIRVGAGKPLSKDSSQKYGNIFFSSTTLEPHFSRYEGLKSSGKLGIIENSTLLNDIIDLNESTLVRIQVLNDLHLKFIEKTSEYIQQNARLDRAGQMTNAQPVLQRSELRFMMMFGVASLTQNIIPAHQAGIKKCAALLTEIDKEIK